MLQPFNTIHFVGVGGIGMSALARVLIAQGKVVSGSDMKDSPRLQELQSLGIQAYPCHSKENLPAELDYLVLSTAISSDNPEVIEAKERGIPILHRSDVLDYVLRHSEGVAVTGTHGKTTTSSMMALLLQEAGFDPTAIIGGMVPQLGSNAIVGKGRYTVAEVDESDQSLRKLSAKWVVMTNLEAEHLDHYSGFEEILDAAAQFVSNQPQESHLFLNWDDAGLRTLFQRLTEEEQARVVRFGMESDTLDYRAEVLALHPGRSEFKVFFGAEELGRFALGVPGLHNIYNALSAISCGHALGVGIDSIAQAFSNYGGVDRRFQWMGHYRGADLIDDYAHHPSEVEATLATAALQNKPVTLVFQPHRYSRTQAFLEEFAQAVSLAQRVVFTDIFPASEKPEDYTVTISDLVTRAQEIFPDKEILHISTFDAIVKQLESYSLEGEIVMTMGAGSIRQLSCSLVEGL